MRVERLPCPQHDGWKPGRLRQFRPDMILCFASPRKPTSRATFDQFKATYRGTSIIGGPDGGQIVDRHLVEGEAAGVAAGSKAASASFAMYGSQ
jgi:hypothetical protein